MLPLFSNWFPALNSRSSYLGLEITFLLSLCFFIDHLFTSPSSSPSTPAITPTPNATPAPPPSSSRPTPPVPLPPAAPPTRIATRSRSLATNEIQVDSDSEEAVDRYCSKCLSLLEVGSRICNHHRQRGTDIETSCSTGRSADVFTPDTFETSTRWNCCQTG